MQRMRIWALGILLSVFVPFASNIVTDIPGNEAGSPDTYKEFSKILERPEGTKITLFYRIYRYGPSGGENLPLLVQVHEWGGNFARMEAITSLESSGLDFAMLAFQFQNPDDNTWNWWYGSLYENQTIPWVQNEVISIIKECMTTSKVKTAIDCSIDTNRIYIYGMSIGGTGALQIGLRHPEIFAAVGESAGWTRYWGRDNMFFSDNRGCLAFTSIIGGISGGREGSSYCDVDSAVFIKGNSDQVYLPLGSNYKAFQYTDLKWYFSNYRDPGFESPFIFMGNGDQDNPSAQGDNLQPSLEVQKRGYSYTRFPGEHSAATSILNLKYLQKFRKNQSFCAFTRRTYGLSNFTSTGTFNDLETHGWDPESIIDEANRYYIKLTGSGTADVTLRRLQKLIHEPGTVYNVTINGSQAEKVVADEYGLVTIPQVKDNASIDLTVLGTNIVHNNNIRDLDVTVLPNTFKPEPRILLRALDPLKKQHVTIGIYSTDGKLIHQDSITDAQLKNGFIWKASQHTSGVYLVRVTANHKTLLTMTVSNLK